MESMRICSAGTIRSMYRSFPLLHREDQRGSSLLVDGGADGIGALREGYKADTVSLLVDRAPFLKRNVGFEYVTHTVARPGSICVKS